MKRVFTLTCVVVIASFRSLSAQQGAPVTPAQQTFTGTISDSMCGASHKLKAGTMTERQCIFECLKSVAKYVLVDQSGGVMPIANQELMGLPLYAGRPVTITGELKDGAIVGTRVQAYPPHLHMFHVMTNWRDTPGGVGFLIAAISEAKVAVTHARLAARDPNNLADMQLHAGHVLNALDPSIEPKGPGAGYGVKKGAAGAQQHLDFAVKADGATANMKTHAVHVTAALTDVAQWTDEAIAVAQKIRTATAAADAAPLVVELNRLTSAIADGVDANKDGDVGWQTGEGGLAQAQAHMVLMMKGEGVENAPR